MCCDIVVDLTIHLAIITELGRMINCQVRREHLLGIKIET
jgi:hypothetical protein